MSEVDDWGDETVTKEDDKVDGHFLVIDLMIGENRFHMSMQKLMELKLGNIEFYSPICIGINLEEIGKAKCLLINALHLAKRIRTDWEINISKLRKDAEKAILIQRQKDKDAGIRKEVGGQITAQHIQDWININKSNSIKSVNDADDNVKILEDNYEILVSRASELKNIIDIARDEWKSAGNYEIRPGKNKDGYKE